MRRVSTAPASREGSTVDLEIAALRELAHRVKHLRARVLLPAIGAAIVAGHAGVLAHAMGYWSIFGVAPDGTYALSTLTIVVAFVLPVLPFAIPSALLYRVLGGRLRRAWCDEFEAKHGLPREMLERNAGRYG